MKDDDSAREDAIRRIGRELAAQSAGLAPTIFDPRWWSGSLLDWCMKDEAFKVQLFRFIDVLPSLRTDEQVARLASEYFDESALAGPLRWGLRAMSATKLGSRLSVQSLRRQINQMARTFIAGATIEEALPVLLRLWTEGRGFSVDLLGEATVSEKKRTSTAIGASRRWSSSAKPRPTGRPLPSWSETPSGRFRVCTCPSSFRLSIPNWTPSMRRAVFKPLRPVSARSLTGPYRSRLPSRSIWSRLS